MDLAIFESLDMLLHKLLIRCDSVKPQCIYLLVTVDPLSLDVLSVRNENNDFRCLKTAKVIPIYKSGDRGLPTYYHPISILTCFSEILEKLIFTAKLTNNFDKHSLISTKQYGFQKHHSTSHDVLDVL